ncbi:MAG TPA: Smr/MutS family protein, partial [Thermoanaerobaculia bacterium]|nr:Smr/MutS family protein [Thermoanaerobaculia bacterium]
ASAEPPKRPAGPPAPTPAAEVVLVGKGGGEALPEVEHALNDALLTGRSSLRIVHGHGTGRLAAAVREFLDSHPGVAAHRPGEPREGGTAVTIAVLDV